MTIALIVIDDDSAAPDGRRATSIGIETNEPGMPTESAAIQLAMMIHAEIPSLVAQWRASGRISPELDRRLSGEVLSEGYDTDPRH